MKSKIIEGLKTKFVGVQDNVLNRIADKISKTVTAEDQIETAIAGVEFQQVLDMYGDSRATEAQASSVMNYEKKHGLKDGKAVQQQQQYQQKDDDDTPSWAKSILQKVEGLEQKQTLLEKKNTSVTVRQQIEAKLKDEKITGDRVEILLRGVDLSNETEIDSIVTQVKADFLKWRQADLNDGIVIDKPRKAAEGEETDLADLDSWAKSKKSQS